MTDDWDNEGGHYWFLDKSECRSHWFPLDDDERPVIGSRCVRCGIRYCPIAYDHYDPDLDWCRVCGWGRHATS